MQETIIALPAIKLVGISCRTNNLAEMGPATAQIGKTIQEYSSLLEQMGKDKNTSITYCVYTDYASDYQGDYTYFIGKVAADFEQVSLGLETCFIPAQAYVKFTTETGKMPQVCVDMWQEIWKMSPNELGGSRAY